MQHVVATRVALAACLVPVHKHGQKENNAKRQLHCEAQHAPPHILTQFQNQASFSIDACSFRKPIQLANTFLVISGSKEPVEKGLLGWGRRWIYQLISSEDITKVYDVERELERTRFGTVYLAKDKRMGYYRIVKKIAGANDAVTRKLWMKEFYTLMALDHPYGVKMIRVHDDGEHLYIVSDFCRGPSLHKRLQKGRLSEQEVGSAMIHMLKAVKCCLSHYKGHYDINPKNFMFTDTDCVKLKMIDFGSSSGFKRDTRSLQGATMYTAPEVFSGIYGTEADVWSCGAILFLMATGEPLCPFEAKNDDISIFLMDRSWVKERLAWASQHTSPQCMDLLRKMLCHDRHMRINIATALRHPFVEASREVGEYISPENVRKTQDSIFAFLQKGKVKKDEEDKALQVIKSMTENFLAFGKEPVLVRAALLVMAHLRGHTAKETRIHRLAYSLLDSVGSGELFMDSIEAAISKCGLDVPVNLVDAFKSVDLNFSISGPLSGCDT